MFGFNTPFACGSNNAFGTPFGWNNTANGFDAQSNPFNGFNTPFNGWEQTSTPYTGGSSTETTPDTPKNFQPDAFGFGDGTVKSNAA